MKQALYCSFCGFSQHEAAVLIKGPDVNICDRCTGICARIVQENTSGRRGELLTEDPDHGDDEA